MPSLAGLNIDLPITASLRFTLKLLGPVVTPIIIIMTCRNVVQERVAFWLHELPGQEIVYHHVSLLVVFWLHLRTIQRRLRRSNPIFGRHADITGFSDH